MSAKITASAMLRQLYALNAPSYRLTFQRQKPDGSRAAWNYGSRGDDEIFFTASDLLSLVSVMRAQNAKGWNVFITPIDPNHHYILIDDLSETGVRALVADEYTLAVMLESSPGNHQAVLICPREEWPGEQSAANRLMTDLNRRFDGDLKISAARHPFRLAGFTNRKEKHRQQNGGWPFVMLRYSGGGKCQKAADKMVELRGQVTPKTSHQNRSAASVSSVTHTAPGDEIVEAFLYARGMIEGLARSNGWPLNESVIDFRAAKMLFENGAKLPDIRCALLHSPNLSDRHSNPGAYAASTAVAALAAFHGARGAAGVSLMSSGVRDVH